MQSQVTWVRIGLNGSKIRGGDPRGWRCFFGDDLTEFSVKAFVVEGKVNSIVLKTGTIQTADRRGLVGWIEIFGICTIENDVLYISPKAPTMPPPTN